MIDEKVLLQSRPEALNDKMDMDLQNQKGGYNNGWNDCLFMFIDIIKKQPKVCEWIPVSERLPEEHDSIFAKLYGTDKWSDALWRTQSKEVLVTLEYEDGIRTVKSSHTTDGKWSIEKKTTLSKFKVVAWMELLKPYEGEPGNKSISRYAALSDLKKQGFFRNVPANVAINEILRNCEVVG